MKNSLSDMRFRLGAWNNLVRVYWRYYVLPYVLLPALAGAVFGYYAPDIACYCAQQYRNYRDQRSEFRGPPYAI